MNRRLKQEIDRYEDFIHGFEGASRDDCIGIAQHFYNLALEDVRKECDEIIKRNAKFADIGLLSIVSKITREAQILAIKKIVDKMSK